MVHALEESWRVLVPHGTLIDLRPTGPNRPLVILLGSEAKEAGEIDTSAGLIDDKAADEALQQVVSQGRYKIKREALFHFSYYWDSLPQMQSYLETFWNDFAVLPAETWAKATQIIAQHPQVTPRIQVSTEMQMRIYEKVVI